MPYTAPPPWRTVVLSPHFDDAVLSLAGLLPELPGPVAVVTVHGGAPAAGTPISWWDGYCGFSSTAEAHTERLAEDARACALLGVAQIVLDHPDNPYAEDVELAGLEAFLRELAPGTRVLVPLSTRQRDHRTVRLRALSVLADLGAPLPWVYADLPYTGHVPEWGTDDGCAALAADIEVGTAYRELLRDHRLEVRAELTLSDAQWARKRAAVQCYGSQLAALAVGHGSFLARSGPLTTERIWSLEPLGSGESAGSGDAPR
ncbi:PIG-L family deacetylase [Streptomyces sp. NPDC000594]|uniref:PIG-L deacetylase family protein n=1 Tax=Streptomyces sp. NPDC000594 TaxID=3154261 RepID=UPI00331AE9C4